MVVLSGIRLGLHGLNDIGIRYLHSVLLLAGSIEVYGKERGVKVA